MKNFWPRLMIVLTILISFGCNSKKAELKKDLEKFMTSKIKIPDFKTSVFDGKDTLLISDLYAPVKMVMLYDSTVCGSCQVSQIWQWQIVTDFAEAMQNKFEPIFIFAPAVQKEQEVRTSLKTHPFEWPIFIDSKKEFQSLNPALPKNKILHTFLLDKENKVVLVGDPVTNPKLWELYKSTIKNLIDNDGLLKH